MNIKLKLSDSFNLWLCINLFKDILVIIIAIFFNNLSDFDLEKISFIVIDFEIFVIDTGILRDDDLGIISGSEKGGVLTLLAIRISFTILE